MDWKTRWTNFCRGFKVTDWIMVFFTGMLCFVAFLQYEEMKAGGIDTHALAKAAESQKASAEKSAQASQDFAETADKINNGIQDAVTKLNTQAQQLRETATQTANIVANTKKANEIAQKATGFQTRPWVGIEMNTNDVTVTADSDPHDFMLKADFSLLNYGTSPALHLATSFRQTQDIGPPRERNAFSCEKAVDASQDPSAATQSVFPHQPIPRTESIPFHVPTGYPTIALVGCVAYQGIAEKEIHTTTIMFRFSVKRTENGFETDGLGVRYVSAE